MENDDGAARKDVDRGYAWLLLLIAFLISGTTAATVLTFGVYYNAWVEFFPEGSTNRQLSAIAALHLGGFSTSGAVAGWIFKRFGFRPGVGCGLLLSSTSYASLALLAGRSFIAWYALASSAGIGNGIASVGGFGLVGHYFERKRHLAAFLLMCAPCSLIIASAPTHQYLADRFGVSGSMLVLSCVMLQLFPLSMLIREPAKATADSSSADGETVRQESSASLWRLSAFWLYCIQSILSGGFIVVQTFVVRFATTERGLGESEAAMMLSYVGIGILLGRIFLVVFEALGGSRRVMGHLALHHVSSLAVGCGVTLWPMCGNSRWALVGGMVALSFTWGIKFGLLPGLLMDALGPKNLASAWGLNNFVTTFSFVLLPIGAGWLADRTGSLTMAFYIAGPMLATSTVFVGIAQYLAYRKRCRETPLATECELLQVNDRD